MEEEISDLNEFINELPKPALQEILLKLNRPQLNAICSVNRKVFSICKEHNFKEMYNKVHRPEMIHGNLHLDSDNVLSNGSRNLTFHDDINNNINIIYKNDDLLSLSYWSRNIYFSLPYKTVGWEKSPKDKYQLLMRLEEIGKEKWRNEFTYKMEKNSPRFIFSDKVAHEIWAIIQRETSKILPELKNVNLSNKSLNQ